MPSRIFAENPLPDNSLPPAAPAAGSFYVYSTGYLPFTDEKCGALCQQKCSVDDSSKNTFDSILNGDYLSSPFDQIAGQSSRATSSSTHTSVKMLYALLQNGEKYGVSFVFGDCSSVDTSKLKDHLTLCDTIDAIENTCFITGKRFVDKLIPWGNADQAEIELFLRNESPHFEALWEYYNTGL